MKLIHAIGVAFALLFAVGAASAQEYKVGNLEIIQPNARAMLNGQKVGGGFMTITNHGKTDDRLVSIASPVTNNVQLHKMVVVDGIMKMRQMKDGIPLPAGKTVKLQHGGLHVMFMNIATPFKEGDMIPATLHFEKAGDVDVKFVVGPANGKSPSQDGMKTMKGMNSDMKKTN